MYSYPRLRKLLSTVSLAMLVLIAVGLIAASMADLLLDEGGLPQDHLHTYQLLSGADWAPGSGPAAYIALLERGYAVHELTFGLLFLVIVLGPLRRGHRWAWWAAWIPMISCVGYAATFGWHDPFLWPRSLAAVVVLALALIGFAVTSEPRPVSGGRRTFERRPSCPTPSPDETNTERSPQPSTT